VKPLSEAAMEVRAELELGDEVKEQSEWLQSYQKDLTTVNGKIV
jgi:hypothetical protein